MVAGVRAFVARVVGAADEIVAIGNRSRLHHTVELRVADLHAVAELSVVAVGVVGDVVARIRACVAGVVRAADEIIAIRRRA